MLTKPDSQTVDLLAAKLQREIDAVRRIDVGSGPYETAEMQRVGRKYLKAIVSFLQQLGATDIKQSKNHYERTVKFSISGYRWAIYSGDFRNWPSGMLGPFFRTVQDDNDHTGGRNMRQPLPRFAEYLAAVLTAGS